MRVSALVILSLLILGSGVMAQETKETPAPQPAVKPDKLNREALEKAFAEKMSNAALVGHFTDRSRENAKLPREEKYTLGKVAKLQGDYWLIQARIQYGEHDVSLPLSLRVVWAGDTPVITLDKMPIPGFGTFTCRVMIFGDQYAGTWDGGDHGGHLFGKIVPAENKDRDAISPAKDGSDSKKNGASTRKN
ncbi:MAG: hypothetical protein WD894_12350 [Pirellulales bacterium]